LLLDTHALVWALSSPRKLPRAVAAEVSNPENQVFASAASTWELAIKSALGKVDVDIEELLRAVDATGFVELPVKMRHTARVKDLPPHHRDPFDRLLIAQAREEGLTLVTRHPTFEHYDVATMWK
jgi:PIN domain nuclease of toxin-antitoxin system